MVVVVVVVAVVMVVVVVVVVVVDPETYLGSWVKSGSVTAEILLVLGFCGWWWVVVGGRLVSSSRTHELCS